MTDLDLNTLNAIGKIWGVERISNETDDAYRSRILNLLYPQLTPEEKAKKRIEVIRFIFGDEIANAAEQGRWP